MKEADMLIERSLGPVTFPADLPGRAFEDDDTISECLLQPTAIAFRGHDNFRSQVAIKIDQIRPRSRLRSIPQRLNDALFFGPLLRPSCGQMAHGRKSKVQ